MNHPAGDPNQDIHGAPDGMPSPHHPAPSNPAITDRTASVESGEASFDLVVIGGGINGVGIAWDASMAGLRVLLLDKSDFGSGTSSWSSRMVHGGLKYLEVYDVALVRESLREREWLLRSAPHLVQPLAFVLPFYRWSRLGTTKLRLGMLAYDALSLDKTLDHHQIFSRGDLLGRYPGINADGLTGGARYFDGQVELSERLVLEVAQAAQLAGATMINYARVERVITDHGRFTGVEFTDRITGRRHTVAGTVGVNVTGPWVNQLLSTLDEEFSSISATPLVGGTKGSHFVVGPFPDAPQDAMYYEAKADGRPLMVIPWLGKYLIGSTDLRTDDDLDRIHSTTDELEYVLAETNALFPSAGLTADDVLYSYCGVRPLPYDADKPAGDITRRHIIHDHRPDIAGFYSVIGGKLTTFRALAEHAVRELLAKDFRDVRPPRRRRRRSPTRMLRLPGAAPGSSTLAQRLSLSTGLPIAVTRRLVQIYGGRAAEVAAMARSREEFTVVIDPGTSSIVAQVVWAVEQEHAVTVGDIVARRIMTGLEDDLGLGSVDRVADALVQHCGWSVGRAAADIRAYRNYLQRLAPTIARATDAQGGDHPAGSPNQPSSSVQ